MTAPNSVSLNDLALAFFKAAVPAADLNLGVTLGQGVPTNSSQVSNKYQSSAISGTQTAPTAGTAICTLSIGQAGYYKIQVNVGFGGTAESTALDNFQLKNGGAGIGTVSVQNVANTISPTYEFYLNCAGSSSVTINALAAASAGSIYKATIIGTRVA